MKIIGVIPARWSSSRFPGKPLANIANRPMIQHVYERAKLSKILTDVIIATDDERIYDAAVKFGAEAVMTPSDLPNGTTRVESAVRDKNNIDAVINIQGDEPLLDPLMIDEVAELLKGDEDCATLCREFDDENYNDPNAVKVVISQNNHAIYFSRSIIPFERNKRILPVYQHIGIYGYKIDFLKKYIAWPETPLSITESLEQLKILEHDYKIKIAVTKSKSRSIGVDTPEDLEAVRKILEG